MAAEVSVQSGESRTPGAGNEGRQREEMCVCEGQQRKRAHTGHIDLASVMVKLQYHDLARGVEAWTV